MFRRLNDALIQYRAARTSGDKRGLLIISSGGIGDSILFSLMIERFMALVGEDDPVTPMDQVRAIQQSYASHGNAEIVAHAGATHNFSLPGNDAYPPEVAETSRAAVRRCFETMR